MNKCQYKIERYGDDLAALLEKIEGLGPATASVAGLLSATDKQKLDKLGISFNTTKYWNLMGGFIPKPGEIIIYSDYRVVTVNGKRIEIPGIKVGTGNAYVQDLAFIGGDETEIFAEHIQDQIVHITAAERAFWNNKLNVTDSKEVVGESLIFNRN